MAELDTVIKGGTIVDGLRTPRYTADVGIKDGRIAYIGSIPSSTAERALDASGLIVAPGFVDLHTHYDAQVFWDPYCTISGWHGVTSVVIGNCGFGFAPVKPKDRDRNMLTMARNEAIPLESMQVGMPWDWETYPEFLDSLDRTPKGINLLSYVGLNPLMMYVMGLEAAKSRPATAAERAEMCRLLEEALNAGGCGFSAQLAGEASNQRDIDGTLMITNLMSRGDLYAFCEVLRKCRRGFIQLAGTGVEECEKVAELSGRPVIYNTLSLGTDQHGTPMLRYRDGIKQLDEANRRGHRVFAQAVTAPGGFEFTLRDWNLFDQSPAWRAVTLGTPQEKAAQMRDASRRQALKDEYDAGEKLTRGVTGFRGIASITVEGVVNPELARYEGLTIAEIAAQEGKHPIDAMLDLALADGLDATFVTTPRSYDMGAMKEMATSPFALPGISDGGAHTKFITFGSYPTEFLTELVRDHELMSLEEAHWRLSSYPALAAGFTDRGWIREGAPADIVAYDYANLKLLEPEKAYDVPADQWRRVRRADGYRWILVNGEVTFEDGACTGAVPGQLLRHGRAAVRERSAS